jgi:autotransporter-associated beta strand protein
MKINRVVARLLLILLACAVTSSAAGQTNSARVLILNPQKYFAATNIASFLQAELEADGRYSNVVVNGKDIVCTNRYAEALLGFYYHPDYRDANLTVISTGNWTHVVMIDKPFYFACAVEFHFEAVDHLAAVIRAAGAQPVLMMPWIETSTIEDYASSNALVREYAWRVGDGAGVTVAPAGWAWNTLPSDYKGTVPASPYGGVGINTNGSYSAACSLYTCLTGSNAASLAYSPTGLDPATRDAIAQNAYDVASAEAGATHYSGAFQSRAIRMWPDPGTNIRTLGIGSSTEGSIGNQLTTILQENGRTAIATGTNIVFGRLGYVWPSRYYDTSVPPVVMVASFDRQYDTVGNGVAGARDIEWWSSYSWGGAVDYANMMIPYHLLWVKLMYDLRVPGPKFSVHAWDWQFYATASALYTLRTGGSNGVYRNNSPRVAWTSAIEDKRYCWQTGSMAWQTMWRMTTLQQAPSLVMRSYGLDRLIDAEYPASHSEQMTRGINASNTFCLAGITNGMYAVYPIDFGTNVPQVLGCYFSVAGTNAGQVEVHKGDTNGVLLSTCNLVSTGSYTNWRERGCVLTNVSGTGEQDLAFLFKGSGQLPDLDYFRLSTLAQTNEACWGSVTGGSFNQATNWLPSVPGGMGAVARFSFDLPAGAYSNLAVTVDGATTLGTLELGHGIWGGAGTVALLPGPGGSLMFDVATSNAVIRKLSGGNDRVAVPVQLNDTLKVLNGSSGTLELAGPVTGGRDVYWSNKITFSGTNMMMGGLLSEYGSSYASSYNAIWSADGVISNFYLRGGNTFTITGGSVTNIGYTEIANEPVYMAGNLLSVFTISGGLFRHASTNMFRIGKYGDANLYLDGGIFETATSFTKMQGNVEIGLNGGLFRYIGQTNVTSLLGTGVVVNVGAGGARFDIPDAGRNVALGVPLLSTNAMDGGFTKYGMGTLTLDADCSWRGGTAIEGGTLRMATAAAIPSNTSLWVATGATLDLGGYSLTVAGFSGGGWVTNGTLRVTGLVALPAGLHIQGNLTLADSALELGATDEGPVWVVGGELTLGGTLQAAISGVALTGTNVVLIRAGSISGTFATVTLPKEWELRYMATEVLAVMAEGFLPVGEGMTNGVPYRESFERFRTNTVLVGRCGWSASDDSAVSISRDPSLIVPENAYSWHFPIATNHEWVATIGLVPVTNRIAGPVGTNTWVDMMIRFPARLSDDSPPADGAQCGFILGTGGLLRAYHYSPAGGTNGWIDYLNAPVPTGEWVRLTAQLDHHCAHPLYPGRGWFQCYLNGKVLTNTVALTSPDAAGVAGGSWMQLAVTNVSQMSSLTIDGMAAVDDLVVDTVIPRGFAWTVRATAGPHGWVSPAGNTVVWNGSNVTVDIHADPYYGIGSVLVDGMTQGVVSQYVFVAVTNDRSLDAVFAEQLATNSTPLWWLANYGYSNGFDTAALVDADHDGMTNWQEYIAGTDPTNGGSVLVVSNFVSSAPGQVVLQWPSVADRVYAVERATNLNNGFSALATNLAARTPMNSYTDVVDQAGALFYRIRVER